MDNPFYCVLCNRPVDLTFDPCDETGKPVHQKCYFDRIIGKADTSAFVLQLANPAVSALAFR
jgi:hypothetical protein